MFQSSFGIGRIAGVPIRVHLALPFLMVALILRGVGAEMAYQATFVLALFGCICLHELGHALTARKFQIPTREIVLHPLGGFAALGRTPKPKQQILISLAGPAVNIALAAILYLTVDQRLYEPASFFSVSPTSYVFDALWRANLALAIFNLLPAYPLDGGQVLLAALTPKLGTWKATKIATGLGQLFGWGFLVYGLVYGNLLLAVVGISVVMGSVQAGGWLQLPKLRGSRKSKVSGPNQRDDFLNKRLETELERRKLKELFERSFDDDELKDK